MAIVAAVCVLLVGWSVTGSVLPNPNAEYAKSNVAAVAKAAAPQLRPGDVVVVTQTEQVPVLKYYLPPGLVSVTPTGPDRDPGVVDGATSSDGCNRLCPAGRGPHHRFPSHRGRRARSEPGRASSAPTGTAWNRAVTTQVVAVNNLIDLDPALLPVLSYTEGLKPTPFSPIDAVLFEKTSTAGACRVVLVAPVFAAVLVRDRPGPGLEGVDAAAQVHRVDAIRNSGFGLWDPQWYGGHWTLDYSVLYPLLAALLGVSVVAVLSAAVAALAFDRLARPHFPAGGMAASVLFTVGTVVQSAIGQLPFLTGEALGLVACWAFSRRRWAVAAVLAFATTLCSPLAGGFVALALAAWASSRWRAGDRPASLVPAAVVVAAAVGPLIATAVLFPGEGDMPYPTVDWAWEMIVAAGILLAAGRAEPAIRWGAVLFMAAATCAVAVPTPLGGNIGRLEDILALPLAVALLWTRWRVVLPLAVVPLVLSQWSPAWAAITSDPGQPSTHRSFFTPLDAALQRFSAAGPAGRVEVVPTEFHWEAAYVAPVMALARGWERQLDVADNPIFYRSDEFGPASYRAWLLNNGVRFVALANAPLDMAGQAEGRLVSSGTVAGLRLIWQSADWRLYSVSGSRG